MPLCCFDADAAELIAPGPYTACSAGGDDDWPFWFVTNDGRTNVLRFGQGAVLTDKPTALEIVRRHNR